jgi:hypothetical protein
VARPMMESWTEWAIPDRSAAEVLAACTRALVDSGFEIRRQDAREGVHLLTAVLGGPGAFLIAHFVPFGDLMKSGKHLGAEVQVSPRGMGAVLRIAVAPYMELFDAPEVPLLTQGILEMLTDDAYAAEKFQEVLGRLRSILTAREEKGPGA